MNTLLRKLSSRLPSVFLLLVTCGIGLALANNVQVTQGTGFFTGCSGTGADTSHPCYPQIELLSSAGSALDGTAGSSAAGVLTIQGIASMTPVIATGSGSAGSAAAGVLTVQGIASMTKLLVTPDSVALPANQSVNVSQINAHTLVEAGTTGVAAIGGATATNVAITEDPLNLGAQAVTSENTAATTSRKVQMVADKVGKLIVLPYANPENFTSGVTAAMTGTTSTSLLGAPAGSLRNYLTHLVCTNSHATVGTFVLVQDGSSGTTIYEAYAAAVGGGFSLSLPTPLKQPTAATALFVQDVTTGSNVICAGSGYQGL